MLFLKELMIRLIEDFFFLRRQLLLSAFLLFSLKETVGDFGYFCIKTTKYRHEIFCLLLYSAIEDATVAHFPVSLSAAYSTCM